MQPSAQQVHEDLASLFSRNLTFNPELRASAPKETPRQEPLPAAAFTSQPIVYSISQHYHHSAHVVKPAAQPEDASMEEQTQRPASEPPQPTEGSPETILRNYGIDAAILTPSQLQLFRIADEPQKLRLIELWSICPPKRAEEISSLAWSSTSVEQEEHLARMRYERLQQGPAMSLDGTQVQTGDGRWTQQASVDSEPYMTSGYEELMRRENERQAMNNRSRDVYGHFGTAVGGPSYTPATDPVYMGPDMVRHMDMATQYGAFEQFRGAAEADAMDVM